MTASWWRSPVATAAASVVHGNARRAPGRSMGAVLAKRAVTRAAASGRSIERPIIACT